MFLMKKVQKGKGNSRANVLVVDFGEDSSISLAANELITALRSREENNLDILLTNSEEEANLLLRNLHIPAVIFINGGLDAEEFFQSQIRLLTNHKLIVIGGYGTELLNSFFFRRADVFLQNFDDAVPKFLEMVEQMMKEISSEEFNGGKER